MPNTWTKAMQALNEKFQGPRTNDSEIKLKLEKAETIEKSLKSLKNIICNFSSYFEKILSYNREISESIFILFDNNQEFKEFAEILTQTNDVVEISKKTDDWPNYFNGLKNMDTQREESRKIYDHYEKKLEKLNDEKEKKIKKGAFQENSTFAKKLERNEEKFVTSKSKYIDNCIELYDKVDNLLNDRFTIINPVLLKLFYIEMRIYESFNGKFKTYKNLEEKFNSMKTNFERKERVNDYDPQKFMKNPKIEENFENRKFSMVEYRKSVHARSKSQTKPNNNNNNNKNPINNNNNFNGGGSNRFQQVSNLDETPGRKPNIPLSSKDAFFFESDNVVEDFNKIDNNFSNLNLKGKDSAVNIRNKSNLKQNIPISRFEPHNEKTVAFGINTNNNNNNAFNNSFNINNNNTNKFGSANNNPNNSFNAGGAFEFFSGSKNNSNNNNNNNPVKINTGSIGNNSAFKAIDDFNEIFGNPNLKNNNNNNNFNNKNNNQFNYHNNNNFMQSGAAGNDFGFNEANVIFETHNDFGNVNNNNAFNMFGNNNGNIGYNIAINSDAIKFNNNFDFAQIDNHHLMVNNNNNNFNMQANPGMNNIDILNNNEIGSRMNYPNNLNSYPSLDNVLDNNNNNNMININSDNNNNNFNNKMLNPNYNQINIVPMQIPINNVNLNNFNSGIEANSGNPNKRSSTIYLKNQNEDFENILNNSKQNHKANKDSDPFEGYY